MTEPTAPTGIELGPLAERAWQHLAVHVRWHPDSFWVAWVFADDPRVVREYQRRMAEQLATSGRAQQILQPDTPQGVRDALEQVLSEHTRAAHCLWLEVLRSDIVSEINTGEHPWQDAWAYLMMRANEHRGRISRHLPGGLIFVGSSAFKAGTAAAAPDLWSIRSLVLEPRSLPGLDGAAFADIDVPDVRLGARAGPVAVEPDVALQQAARMRELGDRAGEAKALQRASFALLCRYWDSDDGAERAALIKRALAASERAIEHLRALAADNPARHELALAAELTVVADALQETGRPDDARAAADEALAKVRGQAPGDVGQFLDFTALRVTATLAIKQRRWADATNALAEAVTIGRDLSQLVPQAMLVASLLSLGRAQTGLRQLADAQASFQEAARRARAHLEDDRETMLSPLVGALCWGGLVSALQGKHTESAALFDEVHALTDDLPAEHPIVAARDAFLEPVRRALQNRPDAGTDPP